MEWLTRPIFADGVLVTCPLDTVEMPMCEGRLLPAKLFAAIDTLQSMVVHGLPSPTGQSTQSRLADWVDTLREFG